MYRERVIDMASDELYISYTAFTKTSGVTDGNGTHFVHSDLVEDVQLHMGGVLFSREHIQDKEIAAQLLRMAREHLAENPLESE